MLQAYDDLTALYGDLHNHCGISYGHGTLEEALQNAREQLDFCSVTGHALWPDMPEADEATQHIVSYHEEGFARLQQRWPEVQRLTEDCNRDGEFVTFISFEMHSCADGDYTVLYNGSRGEILRVAGISELRERLRTLRDQGVEAIAFPHHIAYRRGQRGINWSAYDEEFSPVVEIVSMHGCSEADECPRPFLHSMGPSDHQSTMGYGLELGHHFGVIGSTDHHSAHPGSYGHGRTGLWARATTRDAIWEALWARRTYALTGDRIKVAFTVNGELMGARIGGARRREIQFRVVGGAPIDCIDVVRNGKLVRRISRCDVPEKATQDLIRTKLYLELGWGERRKRTDWDVRFGITEGRVLSIEPRFRGLEVLSPGERGSWAPANYHLSHWEPDGERGVWFRTVTFGSTNGRTPATQGVCLEVEAPRRAAVTGQINGRAVRIPMWRLLAGARTGRLANIGSAGYRFHRAPLWWELEWQGVFEDVDRVAPGDVYYLRVRQVNDEYAWCSPVRVGGP